MRQPTLDPRVRLRLVLTAVEVAAALALVCTTLLAVRQGLPDLGRLVVVFAVATLVSAFPVEIGVGATKFLYNLGELALIIGFALGRPLWLIPILTVARLLPSLFGDRLPARAVVYNAAVRCLAVAAAVLVATTVTPGHPRLFQPWAFVALVVAGLVSAAVSHLLSAAVTAASRRLPYWRVVCAGLHADRLVAAGNIAVGIAILALARWQPAAVVTLPAIYLALRHFYQASLRANEAAQMSGHLTAAHERLTSRLSSRQVIVVLAEEAVRLTGAQEARVAGPDGDVLVTAGASDPLPAQATLQVPLHVDGNLLGQLGLTFCAPGQPTTPEREALATLAATGATVWSNALLHEQIHHAATHDLLTGLLNRQGLIDAVRQLMTERSGGARIAGLLVDLDRFKDVNDTVGHPAGDELLIQIAARLRAAVRDEDVVGRLGGDEFAVVLPDLADNLEAAEATAIQIADRLTEALSVTPVVAGGLELRVEASIGVAVYPDNATRIQDLYRCADSALLEAKKNGRARVARYDQSRDVTRIKRLRLEPALKAALDADDQLVNYYQPQFDLYTGMPVAVQAFVRWHHPTRGLLSTATVAAVAERCDLQRQLTLHVLGRALMDRQTWLQVTGSDLPVVVNLTRRDLLAPTLVAAVDRLLTEGDTAPDRLVLEICEADGVAALATVTDTMTAFADLGVGLSLDRFGTGGASLHLLAGIPVDQVKLDPVFLAGLEQPNTVALVQAMIEAAHRLGIRTAAQGIVEDDQLDMLRRLGCQAGQGPGPDHRPGHPPQPGLGGRLFNPPVDVAELVEVLAMAVTESRDMAATVLSFGQVRPRR